MNNTPFNKFSRNVYSQNGEDGIISEILDRLNLKNAVELYCVEFGAWDGKKNSNTFALVEKGCNAVYIEPEFSRFQDLLNTVGNYPRIIPIQAFVARESGDVNSLDKILDTTKIPKNFDLLSIDIDSYDLDVWDSLVNYYPKIVVIEINSSAPPGIYWRHGERTPGNTFSSTIKVGNAKGYTLVCHTGNLIFVRNEILNLLDFPTKLIEYPELLFLDQWISRNLFRSPNKAINFKQSIFSLLDKTLGPKLTTKYNVYKKKAQNFFVSY
jgi:hypothetical protein